MAITYDRTNSLLTFTATSDTTASDPNLSGQLLDIETIVLEKASAATTITDLDGHVLAVLSTMDWPRPVHRWVNGIIISTMGSGAQVRVYLNKSHR